MRSVLDRQPVHDAMARQTESPDGNRRSPFRAGVVATLVGLSFFVGVQILLGIHNAGVVREAVERGWLSGYLFASASWAGPLLAGAVGYLIVALTGSAIASGGHRFLVSLPALAFVFTPLLFAPHNPQPIGLEWAAPCYAPVVTCPLPWFANPWLAAVVDVTLVSIPAWSVSRRVSARRWLDELDAATVAAIATSVASIAIVWWAQWAIRSIIDPTPIVATAAVGLVLGARRPWWPWLHVLFAAFAAGSLWLVIDLFAFSEFGYSIADALIYELGSLVPIAAVGLIGSAWQPLAWTLRRTREHPLMLVVALNVLNVVDAVMTSFAIGSGHAYESNPVIEAIGLPAKLVLVALLSWILYRRKPAALIWPTVALLWVAAYHVAGVFVNDVR